MPALECGEISGVLPFLGLTPAVTAILSLLLIGKALTASEWLGVVIMTAGVIVVEAGFPYCISTEKTICFYGG